MRKPGDKLVRDQLIFADSHTELDGQRNLAEHLVHADEDFLEDVGSVEDCKGSATSGE